MSAAQVSRAEVTEPRTEAPTPVRLSPARRVLPVLLMAGVYVVLTRLASYPLTNYDTYFHLRFGHEFLSGAWSLGDPGSVTRFATADWVPTQWLPQVVMAQAEKWFGLPGVAWLSGVQFLTLAVTLYWACRRHAEPLVTVLLVFVTLLACTPGMSMRPQQISYVLVVVATAVWLRARDTGRVPWLLVPVTWGWAMCHGMWPVGIAIGVVAVAGLALDRRHPPATLLRMAAVPVLSLVASLLTPVGPGLFGAVLQVNSRAKYFYEWAPPDFTRFYTALLLGLLALAFLPRLRRGGVPWFEVGLLGLAVVWAVYSLRTVPVAACMAAPLAALALQPVLGDRPAVRRPERGLVLGGYVLSLAALALAVPHTADEPKEMPAWLDASLGELPEGTAVLDDQAMGGYLMWRFPQLDLVTHGYGDTFTDAELERNADIDGVRAGWVELVADTGATFAVLAPGSPLAYNLREQLDWQVLERSDDLELLRSPQR